MPAKKEVTWYVDENGCHICNSHCLSEGYPVKNINGKKYRLHRFTYMKHFLNGGNVDVGLVVRHKCDNRRCINPEHLELGTKKDNANDRVVRGRGSFGEKRWCCKLKEAEVIEIYYSDRPYKEISEKYGISLSGISNIKNRKKWKHLTQNLK